MDNSPKLIFKNKLKDFCYDFIQQRIEATKIMMSNAQLAANSEEKSSAGDKYETSRAMGHLEKDMYARQLAEHIKELASLHTINCHHICDTVNSGAFIACGKISFFIATGLGKQSVDDKPIFFLSPQSPLAKQLWQKKAGDEFILNKEKITIQEVF